MRKENIVSISSLILTITIISIILFFKNYITFEYLKNKEVLRNTIGIFFILLYVTMNILSFVFKTKIWVVKMFYIENGKDEMLGRILVLVLNIIILILIVFYVIFYF